jgi:hypothetical protein
MTSQAPSNLTLVCDVATKNFYVILGIEDCASADDVKRAYRRLARKYHPDVSLDPDGERKFKELGEAYNTLKLPDERSAYDRSLSRSPLVEAWQLSHGAWLGWLLWMYWDALGGIHRTYFARMRDSACASLA